MARLKLKHLTFGFLLSGLAAEAATYYVGKSGSDSSSCTQAQNPSTPRLSINGGVSCLAAGDTLQVKAGTYTESLGYWGNHIPSGSSWNSATTITHYGTDSVVVTGAGGHEPVNIYRASDQYIIFDSLILDAQRKSGVVEIGYANHIRISNSEVTGSNDVKGIGIGEAPHCEILDNNIHDNGLDTAHDHGIYLTASDTLISGNRIHHNAGFGIHLYSGGAGGLDNNIIHHNVVYDNGLVYTQNTSGILVTDGNNNLVYDNIVYGNWEGISIGNYGGTSNNKVFNNTVYGNRSWGIPNWASNSTIKNNLVDNNGLEIGGADLYDGGSGTTYGSNLCGRNDPGCAIVADPKMVDASGLNFHLLASSPAIDRGLALSEVPVDFDGAARPQGAGFDIGAYEFISGVTDGVVPSVALVSPANGSTILRYL